MAGTIIKNWFHTFGWGFVHQARLITRIGRRLKRLTTKVHHDDNELKKMFLATVIIQEELQKAFDKYGDLRLHEKDAIIDIGHEIKILIRESFERIGELIDAVGLDKQLTDPEKTELRKMALQLEEKLLAEAKDEVSGFGSYRSITITPWKSMTEASEIADLFYQSVQNRTVTRKLKTGLHKETAALRKNKKLPFAAHQKMMQELLALIEMEIKDHTEIFRHVIFLMQRLQGDCHEKEDMLKRLGTGYSEIWRQNNLNKLRKVNADIEKWVDEEVREGRIFVGQLEHRKAA
jgi:hypothetical protein